MADRRVVCAAIRAADGELLLGIRHYSADMRRNIEQRVDGAKFKRRGKDDQGFVDQDGKWLNRHDAYKVAAMADQIAHVDRNSADLDGPKLYSEGLY